MSPEQLREACQVAGLEIENRATNGLWVIRLETDDDLFFYSELSPMLPSYVADLLLDKVVEDKRHITAAMKALGHWG